ncbi:MAG TPA: alpha-D-ribose 1-methylphosphonate 5-triphosphate diphosphatase [Geminicoccaceae bacterium]|nr:alpha-D-ribose 1-methylphosphonate 5-triphosphate diphosphatase [Geminicoccaceae bacterium]
MTGDELILTNARIVTPEAVFAGTVRVADGLIAGIDDRPSRAPGALDLEGDLLLPGLVEVHTDNLETMFRPRPGVRWPAAAALLAHDAQMAAAGVTTVCDAVCVGFYGSKAERLELLGASVETMRAGRSAGRLRIEHLLHLRCEVSDPAVIELFEPLRDDPALRVVSFMDHTPGQRQWRDVERYRRFNRGKRGYSDEHLTRLIEERQRAQLTHAEANRRRLLELIAGRPLALASHDDTTAEHVAEAAADGLTVSEFPTTVEAALAARGHGLAIVMGAPNVVLGGSHSGNVSALELAGVGLLDALSSDYMPASLLHAAFLLTERLDLPLPEALAKVTLNPARMIGLADRGAIRPGLRADLVRVRADDGLPSALAVWRAGERIA